MLDSLQKFVGIAAGLGDLRDPAIWQSLDKLDPQADFVGKVRAPGRPPVPLSTVTCQYSDPLAAASPVCPCCRV